MKPSKLLVLVLLFAFCVSMMAGCTPQEAPANGGGEQEPIIIAVVTALSGASADMGVPQKHAFEMAFEELNKAGGIDGREVEIIYYDDEADSTKAVNQITRAIEKDGALAIVSGVNSGPCKAGLEVTESMGVVNLIPIAMNDDLIDYDNPSPWTFQVTENNSYVIRTIGTYAKKKGLVKTGIIHDTTAYGQAGYNSAVPIFEELGLEIVKEESHPAGATDLTAQILSLKNAGVDVVFMLELGVDAALVAKTIKEIGWDITLCGTRGINMAAFLDLGGEAVEGVAMPSAVDPRKPEFQDFQKKYSQRFGEPISYMFATLGYDSAQILIEALKRCEEYTSEELKKALESIDHFPGISGQADAYYSFSETKRSGPNEGQNVVMMIKDGQFQIAPDFAELFN